MFHVVTSNGLTFTLRSLGKRHFIQEIKLNGLNFIGTYISKLQTAAITFILFEKIYCFTSILKA